MVVELMPEWAEHERTIVAWPTRDAVWGDLHEAAEREYARLIDLIAMHEPVTLVCRESQLARPSRFGLIERVDIVTHEIDDGWIRDNGPILVLKDGSPLAVDFDFNSWGNRFSPSQGDRSVGEAIARTFRVRHRALPFVLEGGAISWNGAGTVLVGSESAIHPNRNGDVTREEFESQLHELGLVNFGWIPYGLVEDLKNTDGHVDNVAVFVGENTVLAQMVEPANENFERLSFNLEMLEQLRTADGSRVNVLVCDRLPYARMPDGVEQPAPYLNFCLTNGGVILPTVGSEHDEWAAGFFEEIFPSRAVEFAESYALTYGGGGPHCVTMQWPQL